MEQQCSSTMKYPTLNLPGIDARYAHNLYSHQTTNIDYRNLYLQLPPLIYQHYPYTNFTCPTLTCFAPFSHSWSDSRYGQHNFRLEMPNNHNLFNLQNMRVNNRETREKSQLEVINLQSDDQNKKQKNSLVPTTSNPNKLSQKPVQHREVIQLDENSAQKNQKRIEPSTLKSQRIQIIQPKFQTNNNQENSTEKKDHPQIKQNQVQEDNKAKLKKKLKKKHSKFIHKEEKTQKEKKKNEKTKIKVQKEQERSEKKKCQKVHKEQPMEVKRKGQEGHVREIAKYMESHGQIRHGKEFQSDIPPVKFLNNISFNEWLQKKRKRLLKRQVGVITY